MPIRVSNNLNNHLFALLLALLIHGIIVGSQFFSFSTKIQNQQVIQVSFVSPFFQEKTSTSERNYQQENLNFFAVNQTGTLAQNNRQINRQTQNNNDLQKNKPKKQTSQIVQGLQKQDANAQNSAQTEVIFNAAYLNNPSPIYPRLAKSQRIQGKVLILVLVKANGEPSAISISQSSGAKILDEAAILAVSNWKFIPATRFGQNVESQVIIPIEFKIV